MPVNLDEYQRELLFYINGRKYVERNPDPQMTLLEYLRSDRIGLKGAKLGCGEGGCGACTVMVSHWDPEKKAVVHRSINACLAPLLAVDGMNVTTVEGIGSVRKGKIHPVQERMAAYHASQCGFCTPGFVMSMYTQLRNNPNPTEAQMVESLDGNLCRCTGYRPILDAARSFAKTSTANSGKKGAPCPSTDKACECCTQPDVSTFEPYKADIEMAFPQELVNRPLPPLFCEHDRVRWYRPTHISELLELREMYPESKMVGGNTEIGIETKFKNFKYHVLINTNQIEELSTFSRTSDGIEVGASVTLTAYIEHLSALIEELPAHQTESFSALRRQLKWFASTPIRNAAHVGGNIVTASPISDINPMYLAMNAVLTMVSKQGERKVPIRDFFIAYRKVDMRAGEVLQSVFIPYTRPNEFVMEYKIARRREDDIAIVNAGCRVLLEESPNGMVVKELGLGFGGVAPKSVFAPNTEKSAVGKVWNDDLLALVTEGLIGDLPLDAEAPGGMIEFRRSMTLSFFFKFYIKVRGHIHETFPQLQSVHGALPDTVKSAADIYEHKLTTAEQHYVTSSGDIPTGKPVQHLAGKLHTTGEAEYTHDVPNPAGCLYAYPVLSTKAHAKVLNVDVAEALAFEGVYDYVGYKDIQGKNAMGILQDEEVFASETVTCAGQFIGLILADTERAALAGARLVKVEYEELTPILTIDDAVKAESFIGGPVTIDNGGVDEAFGKCDHVIESDIRMGGQEHFYLETNATVAIPKEDGEMHVISSTQGVTPTQNALAPVLGLPKNRVSVAVKRLGGGFGGKETRNIFISCAIAVAAQKVMKPVRMNVDRDVDMMTTGSRHPFSGHYKIGFNKDGKIQAADIKLYSLAGNSIDLSRAVMERATFHVENCYKIPHLRVVGRVCKTNTMSNTAFRGFGGPQGMFVCETYIDHVARTLNMDPHKLREINFYKTGDSAHYGQVLDEVYLDRVWKHAMKIGEVEKRKADLEEFNKNNRWKKRGIHAIPVKFGMSFTAKFMNQAGALVHVYTDGSVLVTHGGHEMGQGLHTKMAQVAARAFGIPVGQVYITETATDKVSNTSPTAASVGADMNGMAVLDACEQIKARLRPLSAKMPDASFGQLVAAAYMERINLSANGYYRTPVIGWDPVKGVGIPFLYYAYGTAVSEVELDCLTGDWFIRRADVVHDVGDSLNPALDMGQVEGAFLQGVGLFGMEEMVFMGNGQLVTRGPGVYKIPSSNDVPLDFRVSLLDEAPCPRVIHSSKGVGEPPLFLGCSALFAAKEAAYAARKEEGIDGYFHMDSPATMERLRLACVDQFTQKFTVGSANRTHNTKGFIYA
eukprot:GFYU01011433.1.p1 GENE.GFYU01011433.1~~GFYU01011433.1.p1  ORF type:complete len:1346 (-),score=473.75 GFYU01011433.1:262-4254(-)